MNRWYLAGKMGGRMGRDVLSERARAKEACIREGIDYIDPADGENVDPDKVVDLAMDERTMRGFVSKDEYAIRHCDGLLILTGDTPSEGTGLEFGLALSLNMPVVMVAPKRLHGELMGFWNIKASAIFETIEDAVTFIGENYALHRD